MMMSSLMLTLRALALFFIPACRAGVVNDESNVLARCKKQSNSGVRDQDAREKPWNRAGMSLSGWANATLPPLITELPVRILFAEI